MSDKDKADSGGVPVLSWFDEPAKHSISSVFHGLNATVESLDLFNRFHNAHTASLRADVQHIKLLGMSTPSKLIDIYNPARVSTDIKRRLYSSEWIDASNPGIQTPKPRGHNPKNIVAGDVFIEQEKRVVVLGGPGAGKTTFLKFLALAYIDRSIFSKSSLRVSRLPFFVPLPIFYRQNLDLFDFLVAPIATRTNEFATHFLNRILSKGQGTILLDSLDEVPKDNRRELLQRLKDFSVRFPEARIIISCRTADYTDTLDSFSEVEITKLELPAIGKIINAWFKNEPEKASRLCEIVESDKSIASLTETPLLLSLLCIQFRHDLALPERKVELFKRCSEALLREWDTSRQFRRHSKYETLTDQAKEKLFELVAANFTSEEINYFFPKAKTIELVSDFCTRVDLKPDDAADILLEIDQHHGILEQFSQDHYAFSHTSFQEYFAARSITSRGQQLKIVQQKYERPDWHQIIEFVVALADEPGPLIKFLAQKSDMRGLGNYPPMAKRTSVLYLLYRCLATNPFLAANDKKDAIDHLINAQFEIARIYADSGVYPMAQLLEEGIRHPAFRTGPTRNSLYSALLPYRKLSNEILKTPVTGYAEAVFEILPSIAQRFGQPKAILAESLVMNLLMPLSRTHSGAVRRELEVRIDQKPKSAFAMIGTENIRALDKMKSVQ